MGSEPCIFCRIAAGRADCSLVFEDSELVAFLDIHPVRPGHLLVVPRRHARAVSELDPPRSAHLFCTGVDLAKALVRSALPCDDVHFVLNDGPAASQTVPHVHLHVVPRRRGDRWPLATRMLLRPLLVLGPGAPRRRLDAEAAAIREALATTDEARAALP